MPRNQESTTSSSSAIRFPERQSLPGSAGRNTPAIVAALQPHLVHLAEQKSEGGGKAVRVLELASGTGEHVAAFAQESGSTHRFVYQPTEADEWLCSQIALNASRARGNGNNENIILPPQILDLTDSKDWDKIRRTQQGSENGDEDDDKAAAPFDAIFAFNLLHITPFEVTHSIFQQLDPERAGSPPMLHQMHGFIAFYGAFKEHEDDELSEGNAKFDADIRSRNSSFGIRSVDSVRQVADLHGHRLAERIAMPSNNWILIFRPKR
ncbi:unnamed protein product [Tilletia laevis]|uniref:Methyltransferase domain-containing protein n=2 Tax=Tilletia TaxID=13289 RepID=A0A177VDQ6_9BASI|nr:hypothetical protein CF336_g2782 [Tilletia laevis]KAE8263851.1 hypothetical protein A4X03_0g1373 [Tilletia caries]KAE8206351.1 hypothetical protein CF335_g1957 [Tilletia laevis]CAD6886489.1 unnamed protein product [Tilletia caries]CAD6906485.1 unnamed protein product [Tilletia laevis]